MREVEAAGWEVHLEAVAGPEACVRARDLARCPRCDEAAGDPLRIGDGSRGPSVLGLYPLPHPDQKIGGWVPGPLEVRDLPDDHRFTDEDIKAWLGEQAHLFTRGLAEGVDLIEVYAGKGRLSDEILARGGIAIKLGLDHGQDFRLARDRALARALFKRLKPAHAWFAWPCTPFCAWMKLAVLRNCDVAPRLREGRVHLRFSIQLAREQRLAKRHSHCENPLTSTAWREPQATHEFADPSWHRTRLDQCTTGLVGPQGDLHLKPTLIRTTHPDVHNALSLRCPADHPHELVQGPATAASAMYSPRLAHLVADIVCRPRTHPKIGGGEEPFSFSLTGNDTRVGKEVERERPVARFSPGTQPWYQPLKDLGGLPSQFRGSSMEPQPEPKVREACSDYLSFFKNKDYSREGFAEAAHLGQRVLKEARGWKEACRSLRRCWIEQQGDHFQWLVLRGLGGRQSVGKGKVQCCGRDCSQLYL